MDQADLVGMTEHNGLISAINHASKRKYNHHERRSSIKAA